MDQEFLKSKTEEYLGKPTGLHQRAYDYKKLWSEDISTLSFLLVTTDESELTEIKGNSLLGLRDAIKSIISEKISQQEIAAMERLDKSATFLAKIGIVLTLAGFVAGILPFLG